MQRLKQNNSGAALPLGDDEFLSASTTQTLPLAGWCHIRMRLAINGEAERSVHMYNGPAQTAFHHEWIVVPAAAVADLRAAVRAAFRERESMAEEDADSQALYRTIVFREGSARPEVLAVEYQDDRPMGPAAAFETAWRLLAEHFPSARTGQRIIPGLVW